MTDADTELCKAIAELEFPDAEILNSDKYGLIIIDGSPRPIPPYLTDPAETVRMLEAILKKYRDDDTWDRVLDFISGIAPYEKVAYPMAAQYLAMLEEKAK